MIDASAAHAAWLRRQISGHIHVICCGPPNAVGTAYIEAASVAFNIIGLSDERLARFIEFPDANAIGKVVVTDRVPVERSRTVPDRPRGGDVAKVELPSVELPRGAVPEAPTPAGHIIAFRRTGYRQRIDILRLVGINRVPTPAVETDYVPASGSHVDVVRRAGEVAQFVVHCLSRQHLLDEALPVVNRPEHPAAILRRVAEREEHIGCTNAEDPRRLLTWEIKNLNPVSAIPTKQECVGRIRSSRRGS